MGDRAGGATHHDRPVVGVHSGHGIGHGSATAAIEGIRPVGQRTDRDSAGSSFAGTGRYARERRGDRLAAALIARLREDPDMSADGHGARDAAQVQIGDGKGIAFATGTVRRRGGDRDVAKDDQIVLYDIDQRIGGGAPAAQAACQGFDIETARADIQMHIGVGLDEAGQRRHAGAAGVESRGGDPDAPEIDIVRNAEIDIALCHDLARPAVRGKRLDVHRAGDRDVASPGKGQIRIGGCGDIADAIAGHGSSRRRRRSHCRAGCRRAGPGSRRTGPLPARRRNSSRPPCR